MSYTLEFYNERVKKEIESWSVSVLADFTRLANLLTEYGPDLRMPCSRAMGDCLFELRPKGKDGIGRVFYCHVSRQRITILHAFIKKTQETPTRELKIARNRMREVQNG